MLPFYLWIFLDRVPSGCAPYFRMTMRWANVYA